MLRTKLLRDLRRTPLQSLLVVVAVALAAALAGTGAAFAAQLVASNGALFAQADVPHLVQMHAGAIDPAAIDAFADDSPDVVRSAAVELIALDSTRLALEPGTTEAASSVEYSAIASAPGADRLLGLDGEPATVEPGGIGLPVDIALDRGIAVGDPIGIGDAEFTVTALIRDALMGSNLASSRRLLVADADLDALRADSSGSEWLVEFWLTDPGLAPRVYDDYLAAGLPANGPMVDLTTFQLLNGISDGLIAAAMLVVAGLLAGVAAMLLSIVVRTSISSAAPQIGVLRAIGLRGRPLRALVLGRHFALITGGALIGALAAIALTPLATESMRIRFGGDPSPMALVAALGIAALVALAGLALAVASLRPALRGSPLPAMRGAIAPRRRPVRRGRRRGIAPAWWTLGLAQLRRARVDHLAIGGIALAATLLAAVPIGLRATVAAPEFAAATGIAVSDAMIGLRQDPTVDDRLAAVEEALRADPAVERFTTLRTSRIPARDPEGGWTGLNVESGDHTAFPLVYLGGRAPTAPGELALSEPNAEAFGVGVGDELELRLDDGATRFAVVGVYRDITNSGRTAKAVLDDDDGAPLWTTVLVDARESEQVPALVDRYAELAAPARVTDVDAARADVLGPIERAATALSWGATIAAIALTALVTGLTLRLLLVRDARHRAVAQAIGAPIAQTRAQYLLRLAGPAAVGVLLGAATAPILGSGLLVLAGRALGVSGLPLLPDPLLTVVLFPALQLVAVVAIVRFGVGRLPPSQAARLIAGQDV